MATKKILLIDDEEDNRKSIGEILNFEGYDVEIACDGDDGFEKLKSIKPDLVLLDVIMPGKTAQEIIKEYPDIKFALFTVYSLKEAEEKGLIANNVVDFIKKPIDIDALVCIVKHNISNQ